MKQAVAGLEKIQSGSSTSEGTEKLIEKYTRAMRLELMSILQIQSPDVYAQYLQLSEADQIAQLWRRPQIRKMFTEIFLNDLGFSVGAEVRQISDGSIYRIETIRAMHSDDGVPEFIQLYGKLVGDTSDIEPVFLGYTSAFESVETGVCITSPELLGLSVC